VNSPGPHDRRFLRWYQRIGLAALATVLAALLIVARTLTPDERGHGTHEQFGLPPCTFYLIFQRPCPACGMTTAWALLLRGDVGRALAANAGGALLAMLGLAAVPWLLVSAIRGQWLGGAPDDRALAAVAVLVSLVTAGQWLWRIM
jgi:hypothetical protein